MLGRQLHQSHHEGVSIDLSPMIDCVFILLIFFIVTTVFVEETGVEVRKPDAAAAVPLERNSILLAITADNQVVYGGRDIGVAGVGAVVRRLLLQEQVPVIIQADRDASHGVFAQVYGEAKLAGATEINFSTAH